MENNDTNNKHVSIEQEKVNIFNNQVTTNTEAKDNVFDKPKLTSQVAIKVNERKNILDVIGFENLKKVAITSIIISALYSLCFSNFVSPNASLFVFSTLSILVLIFMLNSMDVEINKVGYFWIIPIEIIAFSSAVFVSNTLLNFIIVLILMLVLVLQLINFNVKSNININLAVQLFYATIYSKNVKGIFKVFQKTKKAKSNNLSKILLGIAIAIPFIIVISMLLLSADEIFSTFIYDIFDIDIDFEINIFGYIATFVICLFITYHIFLNYIISSKEKFDKVTKVNFDKTVFATALVCINLLFVVFCISQLSYVIFGNGGSSLPSGFTYAEYARGGFFQLLFVSVINFAVILVFINFMENLNGSKLIKTLLTLLVIFTITLVGSSLQRILMYIEAYGFTQLRIQVILFLVFNFILLIFSIIKIVNYKINIGKIVTVIILLGIIANAYIGNGFVAAYLNVDLYGKDKIEELDFGGYDQNSDYYSYINYASKNGLVEPEADYNCYYDAGGWRSSTLITIFIERCK